MQQKLELSNPILFDRVEGEGIIICDTNATICMMSFGPGQECDAYIHPELKLHGGDQVFLKAMFRYLL